MFFENSTRTKISFEVAAKNLGMRVINFDNATSSNESRADLLRQIDALQAEAQEVMARNGSDEIVGNQ